MQTPPVRTFPAQHIRIRPIQCACFCLLLEATPDDPPRKKRKPQLETTGGFDVGESDAPASVSSISAPETFSSPEPVLSPDGIVVDSLRREEVMCVYSSVGQSLWASLVKRRGGLFLLQAADLFLKLLGVPRGVLIGGQCIFDPGSRSHIARTCTASETLLGMPANAGFCSFSVVSPFTRLS